MATQTSKKVVFSFSVIILLIAAAIIAVVVNYDLIFPSYASDDSNPIWGSNKVDPSKTTLAATTDVAMQKKNIVWCPTSEIAWSNLKEIIGGDILLEGSPETATKLNASTYDPTNIDSGSYVTGAGFIKDDIVEKLQAELIEKFNQGRDKVLDEVYATYDPGSFPYDIISYAFLYKALSFDTPFEALEDNPIYFKKETKVETFGIKKFNPYKSSHKEFKKQVKIINYEKINKKQEVILKLLPKTDQGDEIILAMIDPKENLEQCVQYVLKKYFEKTKLEELNEGDKLFIPKIDLAIRHDFKDILRKFFLNKGYESCFFAHAFQTISFQLDQEGVKLESRSIFGVKKTAKPMNRIPTRHMLFNRPFLVLLKRSESKAPYFAMWVDNPDVLILQKD